MGIETSGTVGAMTPDAAWSALATEPASMLVDVRTTAEWAFVGVPDLAAIGRAQCFIEWSQFPGGTLNSGFLEALDAEVARHEPKAIFFLCRSGGRSHSAANAALARFAEAGKQIACINVLEGFEGNLDEHGHRGAVEGWKARGLPWRQN